MELITDKGRWSRDFGGPTRLQINFKELKSYVFENLYGHIIDRRRNASFEL